MATYQISIALIAIFISLTSWAKPITPLHAESWELGFTSDGVAVYYNLLDSGTHSVIQLRISNETISPVKINWEEVFSFYPGNIINKENSISQSYIVPADTSLNYSLKRENVNDFFYDMVVGHLSFKNVVIEKQ